MRHPEWCARDHRCGLGEHRSEPVAWRTEYGTLVATRVRDAGGREWLETRTVVRLARDERRARTQAQHLAVGVDLTVRAVLAGAVPEDLLDDLLGRTPQIRRAA
jgi:hypothetical protein